MPKTVTINSAVLWTPPFNPKEPEQRRDKLHITFNAPHRECREKILTQLQVEGFRVQSAGGGPMGTTHAFNIDVRSTPHQTLGLAQAISEMGKLKEVLTLADAHTHAEIEPMSSDISGFLARLNEAAAQEKKPATHGRK